MGQSTRGVAICNALKITVSLVYRVKSGDVYVEYEYGRSYLASVYFNFQSELLILNKTVITLLCMDGFEIQDFSFLYVMFMNSYFIMLEFSKIY